MTACILIVEDDDEIQTLLREILEDHGYRTVTSHGPDAPSLALAEHPDLVLLDLYLHQTSGVAVGEELRTNPRTADIPVIVISALSQAVHIAADINADAVLQKPFGVVSLQKEVAKALRKAQKRRQGQQHP